MRWIRSGPQGVEKLKGHTFFNSIDWKKLLAKETNPPFKPTVATDEAFYFDSAFTSKTPKGNARLYDEVSDIK